MEPIWPFPLISVPLGVGHSDVRGPSRRVRFPTTSGTKHARELVARDANLRREVADVYAFNRAHDRKVSAETCHASRPAPNAQAAGRQEPPCSASTPLPTQLPAQPKPRSVLHETAQSCALAPSLPRSTAEIHASPPPSFLYTNYFPAS